jgi:Ser/Thr protein kinase RdoA (MazF antagonist)
VGLGRAPHQVLVHGDVTPVNIVFGDQHEVIALDLERLRRDDAAVDLGIVMAEVRHACLRTAHEPTLADSFMARFFTDYVRCRQLSDVQIAALDVRSGFYVGTMALRIARNDWLDLEYRRALTAEGERWLATPGQRLFCSTSTTH